jgi:phospholipid-binding lipoprotein MlaA
MRPRFFRFAAALLAAVTLGACAHRQPPQPDNDPWEPFNRKMFWFNEKLDQYALEPVARGWDYIMPDIVQLGLANFFDNTRFPIVFVNDVLQGKPRAAAESLARFQINTFLGGLGFVDLAAKFGLPPQLEDTGQTFGVWDIAPGPYLVLPIFGPSNPRDTLGLAGDFALGFYTYFVPFPYATVLASAIDILNWRSRRLDDIENAREAALDFYVFQRNAYIQYRWKLINDDSRSSSMYQEEDLYDEGLYEDHFEQNTPPP